MSADNTTQLDIAPLVVIVSETLDPRVRRRLEAEQQADIKTYEDLSRDLQMSEDINKIRQQVADNEEVDPFKKPEPTENQNDQSDAQNPQQQDNNNNNNSNNGDNNNQNNDNNSGGNNDNNDGGNDGGDSNNDNKNDSNNDDTSGNDDNNGGDEDLESIFEHHGSPRPREDYMRGLVKNYLALESSDGDVPELEHIKCFVHVDLGRNRADDKSLAAVQSLKDPENTIAYISEELSPNAESTLRSRAAAEALSGRGVKVFYDLEQVIDYLNELYDVVSGRKKG